MQTASDRPASHWIRPELARLLAILWVVGVALVYLVRFDAWVVPLQLTEMVGASLPGLRAGPRFGEFWMARAQDAGCVLAIVAAALGVGATVGYRLIARRDVLGMLFALAIGLWILAVLTVVVGAVSIAKVPYVFLTLACWLSPVPRKFLGDFFVSTERTDGWGKWMIACLVLAATLNLAGALAPPFEYDELEYHLGALADYQRAGHIVFLPHNFYSNMPQLTEMLYLLARTTTSDIAAKLVHWSFGVLGALAVYGLAQRLWSKAVGLTAAVLFYCVPFVQDLGQTARIDLATAYFTTLAFGALVLWMEDEKGDFVWLSALCAGAAAATKWPAIPIVLLPAALMVVFRRRSFLLAGAFCLLAVMMVAPWLVKNWLLAGNPVYPFLNTWFPSPHWSTSQAMMLSQRHSPWEWNEAWQFFALVWNYSFVEVGAVPLLLMTTPLLLLLPRVEPAAKRMGWLFAGAYTSWFCCFSFTFRPWRFLFPAFGVAAVAAALAMEKLGRDTVARIALRGSVGIVVAISLASLAMNDLVDTEDPGQMPPQLSFARHALGQFSRDEFIARMGNGVLEPVIWMNENLPKDAKVLYVGEARVYYAKQSALWSTAFDQPPLTTMSRAANAPDELLAALRTRGITHVYVNFSELKRLEKSYDYMVDANWNLIGKTLQQRATSIHRTTRGTVYELAK